MLSLSEAARLVGVPRTTLRRLLVKHGIPLAWRGRDRAVELTAVLAAVERIRDSLSPQVEP